MLGIEPGFSLRATSALSCLNLHTVNAESSLDSAVTLHAERLQHRLEGSGSLVYLTPGTLENSCQPPSYRQGLYFWYLSLLSILQDTVLVIKINS